MKSPLEYRISANYPQLVRGPRILCAARLGRRDQLGHLKLVDVHARLDVACTLPRGDITHVGKIVLRLT